MATVATRSSRRCRAGYDPSRDPDLGATLQQILGKIAGSSGGGGKSPIAPKELGNAAFGATVSLREDVSFGDPAKGAVTAAAGAAISIDVQGSGNLEDTTSAKSAAATAAAFGLHSISLKSSGLTLNGKKGPMASLQHLRVMHGGKVEVVTFMPLGKLKKASDTEKGLKGLLAVFMIAGGDLRGAGAMHDAAQQDGLVEAMAQDGMEDAFTKAVHDLVMMQCDAVAAAVPGLDLGVALGIK